MLKGICQVKSAEVDEKTFEGRNGRAGWTKRTQEALGQFGDEVRRFRVPVNGEAYAPGKYEYSCPVTVGPYGDLMLQDRNLKLIPVK